MLSTLIGALIKAVIGFILSFCGLGIVVSGLMEGDTPFGGALMLFFGIPVLMLAWSDLMKYRAQRKTNAFNCEENCEAIELVDKVLQAKSTNAVINSQTFSKKDVRMVVMDRKNEWAMVLTGDCVYEKHAESYQAAATGCKNIRFAAGSKETVTRRQMVDVEQQARTGFFVGGLGVAAMNASDAIKTNAEGGMLVSGGSYYPVEMKSSGGGIGIHCVIIRNDLLEEYGEPYMYAEEEVGRYFTAFFIRYDNAATATQCGKELTKYFRMIAKLSANA